MNDGVTERAFPALEGRKYMRFTTYRRSGEAVATPVWFAFPEGRKDRLYVVTGPNTGKMKRIRAGSPLDLVPSDWRGRPVGDAPEARAAARQLDGAEAEAAEAALSAKYGWQYRAFSFVEERATRGRSERTFLEITPRG